MERPGGVTWGGRVGEMGKEGLGETGCERGG